MDPHARGREGEGGRETEREGGGTQKETRPCRVRRRLDEIVQRRYTVTRTALSLARTLRPSPLLSSDLYPQHPGPRVGGCSYSGSSTQSLVLFFFFLFPFWIGMQTLAWLAGWPGCMPLLLLLLMLLLLA